MLLDLYIQNNCQACEEQLKLMASCSEALTHEVSLLFVGSEAEFKKYRLRNPSLVLRLKSVDSISPSRVAMRSIKGTPTWVFKNISEKGIKKCSELQNLINQDSKSEHL